jgi:hypothetical protein
MIEEENLVKIVGADNVSREQVDLALVHSIIQPGTT